MRRFLAGFERATQAPPSMEPVAQRVAVSLADHETCVLCGSKTNVNVYEPIEQRAHYVSGVGQLCSDCGPLNCHDDDF